VVVENRTGANGNVGGDVVAKARPDGYTLLYAADSLVVINPHVYSNMPFDTLKDIVPIASTTVSQVVISVNPSVPVNTAREFVAYAKANPGKLSYGSAGNGNVTHLAAFQLVRHHDIDATHVPYRGSAPADVDLVAGQIQFMTDTINSVMPFVKDKRLKLLAVTTSQRMSLFPEVPTLNETVMPGFEAGAWQGIMVPANTPKAVVQRLNMEINKALQSAEVKEKLALQGAEPLGSTPEEYGAYIKKELARWAAVVKATGVTLE
jgi:tripartite-type tricarboxylate transporter receptor subunit TctC